MSNTMMEVFDRPRSILNIIRTEWQWWVTGGIFSFVLASILMTGWPSGLWPELTFPYTYAGDGISHSWITLRAIEGWIFDNPRSGYPFGSNFLDYPGSDSGNLLILKLLGLLTGEYHSALNLFFLGSFFASFTSAFCMLRTINLSKVLSVSAALLFTFLPFHFQRLGHLFYTWYFIVPIFFYLAFLIYQDKGLPKTSTLSIARIFLIIAAALLLASFGVYYALFGIIVLATSMAAVLIKTMQPKSLVLPLILIFGIILGVLFNVAPNLLNRHVNGFNSEVAVRSPAEAEIYGLKLMQLILPRTGHRDEHLASITDSYNKNYPLVNENTTASLGLVGAVGFMGAFLLVLAGMTQRKLDTRLSLLSLLIIVLFLFGTIGGFGAVFSLTVSPSIRGWNRISVFIAFASIAIFFIVFQIFLSRHSPAKGVKIVTVFAAIIIGFFGLYDQTISACTTCNTQTKIAFEHDRNFITSIEQSLPPGSAIYQLPYIPFPEHAPLHRLDNYSLLTGFLHSRELRWSSGGMKGRQGDIFYRELSQEPIEEQLKVIRKLGFSGIFIDRRGFNDNADQLIKQLTFLLGNGPLLKREDEEVVFFRLLPVHESDFSDLSAHEIMKTAGYVVDNNGTRYSSSLSEGIDFKRRTWPDFIKNVQGISGPEHWGRWSDARLGRSVRFDFFSPLPSNFTLQLDAIQFSKDGKQDVLIKIGGQSHRVSIDGELSTINVPVLLSDDKVDSIEFISMHPVSPRELGISADERLLGIGFISMRILH